MVLDQTFWFLMARTGTMECFDEIFIWRTKIGLQRSKEERLQGTVLNSTKC